MKTIRIFLFILILIGIGLLCTQKIWVPRLVDKILSYENNKSIILVSPISQIEYNNTQYNFNFSLPMSWEGYSIITEEWEGNTVDKDFIQNIKGPKIIIRHPLWTSSNPRQDIPIMIFTYTQWNLIVNEKLSLGAAPIGPSELGRNTSYVFALPARYNFAFSTGFKEVEKIIESKPLIAF